MRLLLGASLLVAGVAALDAIRGDHWDQFAMLIVIAALAVAGLALRAREGNTVRLRADLMAWVEQQAAVTDDEPRLVIDRALAAYRARMLPESEEGSVER